MEPKQLIELALQRGFQPLTQKTSSHVVWVKRGSRSVPIPTHGKTVGKHLAMTICKQLGAPNINII